MDANTQYRVAYFQNWQHEYCKAALAAEYAEMKIEYQKRAAECYRMVQRWRGF